MIQPTLIISAVEFEVTPLLQGLEKEGIPYEYFALGIGPLHAAHKAHELEKLCEDRKVLYLGTCGSFTTFEKPYLIQARETQWMPSGVRTGISHAVENWYPPVTFKASHEIDLAKKIIFTSPELSLTDHICKKFSKIQIEDIYENMELYAVANALQKAKELNIIMAVTNQVGSEGHNQWKTYFKEAAQLTAHFVLAHKPILL